MSNYPARIPIEDLDDLRKVAEFSWRGAYAPGTNERQAAHGAVALGAYIERVGFDGLGDAMVDLVGDLMHLTDALDLNFYETFEKARRHYVAELHGED